MITLLTDHKFFTAECDFKECSEKETNTLTDNLMDHGWAFIHFEGEDVCLCKAHFTMICDLIGKSHLDSD